VSKVTKTDILEFSRPKILPPIQPFKRDLLRSNTTDKKNSNTEEIDT